MLLLLAFQGQTFIGQMSAPFGQLGQADRAGLVGVQQPLVRPRDPVQPGAQLLVGGTVPHRACFCRGGEAVELRQHLLRADEQAGDVAPHGRLDLLGLDVAARARSGTGAQDGDCRKIGGQAAIAIFGYGSLAGWNFCPKPEPSVPL